MSNGFQAVKKSIDLSAINLSAFNEPVNNSVFFELGEHEVFIEDAELKESTYGENLVVTWADSRGATIKQFLSLFFEDRETHQKSLAKKYVQLSRLFANDPVIRGSFFLEAVFKDTSKFAALKGLKASITIAKGKKGYEIVAGAMPGTFIAVDVVTAENVLGTAFASYKEANDEAKNQGLRRAYNEVTYFKAIESEVAKNEQSLRLALEASEPAASTETLQRVSML